MSDRMGGNSVSQVACPVCRNATCSLAAAYRGHSMLFRTLRLLRCSACGLVFADPMPDAAQLATYNHSYFQNAHDGVPTDAAANMFFAGIAQLRLRHAQTYIGESSVLPGSVLEVGPGLGFFCQAYLVHCPDAAYAAVEADSQVHAHLRNLGAQVFADFDELAAANFKSDLLIMSHVLEHVSEPLAFVSQALDFLNPGGIVFVEVPCRDYEFKDVLEPHLLFFDKSGMRELLTRLGLNDIRLSYHGKDIDQLKRESQWWHKALGKGQRAFARFGWHAGLPAANADLEAIQDPVMRAVARPYEAHLAKDRPAWWLRALARKAWN